MDQIPNSQASQKNGSAQHGIPFSAAASEETSDSDSESIFAFRAPLVALDTPAGLEASQPAPFVAKRPTPASTDISSALDSPWAAKHVPCGSGDYPVSQETEDNTEDSDYEDADTVSNCTDDSEVSIIEAFAASEALLSPQIISALLSIQDDIVDRISLTLHSIAVHHGQHGTRQHPYYPSGSVSSTSGFQGTGSWRGSGASRGSGRKRANEDDDDTSERGGSDDDKAGNNRGSAALRPESRKFACPFLKRYPNNNKLGRRCYGPGWPTVHRVK